MAVVTKKTTIKTMVEGDIIDITEQTSKAIEESNMEDGIVNLFVPGSTAAITTMEYEPGLKQDFPRALCRIVPKKIEYEHDNTWHDGNGHSHIRASLIGPSLTIPFKGGNLLLGTWQQIVLLELDIKARERDIIFQIIGDEKHKREV